MPKLNTGVHSVNVPPKVSCASHCRVNSSAKAQGRSPATLDSDADNSYILNTNVRLMNVRGFAFSERQEPKDVPLLCRNAR